MPMSQENKIKPYTVVDLSTHTVLSTDEIDHCLKEASERQYSKLIGTYAYNGNHAKVNGDAPNFINIPPKKRSRSVGSLYDIIKTRQNKEEISNNEYTLAEESQNPYDVIVHRERSFTAPTASLEVGSIRSTRRKQKVSRIQPPFSPGVAKRKIQQKMQQQQPSKLASPTTTPRGSSTTTATSNIAKPPSSSTKQTGLRPPSSRAQTTWSPPGETPRTGLKTPSSTPAASPRMAPATNRGIPLANQRATLPRLSSKNSDARSDSSSSDGGSQRTTPVMKNSVSPPITGIASPQAKSSIAKPKSSLPSRTSTDKRSLDNLRMKREMSADCLRTRREKSSDYLRKLSTASVPSPRIKQSTESLVMSHESTADNLKARVGSTSSVNSHQSNDSECGESQNSVVSKPTGLKKPTSGLKKPISSGLSTQRKVSGQEPKIKPPVSGLVRQSGPTKPSGISKPSQIKTALIKVPSSATEPPQAPPEPKTTSNVSRIASPALDRKKQDVASSFNKDSSIKPRYVPIQRDNSFPHNEKGRLRHPTVGKLPERLENNDSKYRLLAFQPRITNKFKQESEPQQVKKEIPKTASNISDNTEEVVHSETKYTNSIVCENNDDNEEITYDSKSDISERISYDKDPFADFDQKFQTESSDNEDIALRYDDNELSQKCANMIINRKPSNQYDSDSEDPEDESDNVRGYAEPDDSIKRSEQLSSDSGYIEPLDTLSSSRNSISNYKQQVSNTSAFPDETSSSSGSNPSPRFGEVEDDANSERPDSNASSSSPFKRLQPKVMIPPPRLNSYTDDLLPPLPKEYMRTPSSDLEEFHLMKQTQSEAELRRMVREQAIKVWGKKRDDPINEAGEKTLQESADEDEENTLGGGDYNDTDVFYTSKVTEQKPSDTLERYAARTSLRRASKEETYSMENNMRQLETMTLDRKEKKTSKLKKFFKKLSNKKDGKYENDNVGRHDRLPSTDSENNRLSSTSGYDFKTRRRSDGMISLYSVNEVNYLTQATPLTKRRLFAINLSFMRKGRRQRSNTVTNTTTNDEKPSDTVKALCSPYVSRRNQLTALTTNGRRASESNIYKIQPNIDLNSRFRHTSVSSTTPTTPLRTSTKKYRAPQPPMTATVPTTVSSINTTPLTVTSPTDNTTALTRSLPVPAPRTRGSPNSVSSSSCDDEADYINYPFSKCNIKAPKKPSRTGSKGSCSDPYGNHLRSDSISGSSKTSSTDEYNRVKRHSVLSDDSMVMSSESLSSSQGTGEVFEQNSASSNTKSLKPSTRSDSSLRKTPLRNSIDSYNKLLEVHRQTIDKIAFEVSRIVCSCDELHNCEWNDFERSNDVIDLNLRSYMVVPVACSKVENKSYTAWLRIDEENQTSTPLERVNYFKTTLHRNCLHICHTIEPAYTAPFEGNLSRSIEVNRAFISTQSPKMTLAKFVATTSEKHIRYPEVYERETALILLQVVKGVTYLARKRNPLKSVTSENVFILNNGQSSVVVSPQKQPDKCPSVVVGCLPGIGDFSTTSITASDTMTNLCHQMAFLLYELLHSPFEEELKLIVNSPVLFTTLPDLTIKSTYSRYLQSIIDKLLGTPQHNINSLDELRLTLEIILFGPTDICDHEEKEALTLIKKWHNRRCVDMVTHILKEAPLIMLCASEHHGQEVEKIKRVDQEILLECEFLSSVLPADIFRVSKELRR